MVLNIWIEYLIWRATGYLHLNISLDVIITYDGGENRETHRVRDSRRRLHTSDRIACEDAHG